MRPPRRFNPELENRPGVAAEPVSKETAAERTTTSAAELANGSRMNSSARTPPST
jgi:hypothetical protein